MVNTDGETVFVTKQQALLIRDVPRNVPVLHLSRPRSLQFFFTSRAGPPLCKHRNLLLARTD